MLESLRQRSKVEDETIPDQKKSQKVSETGADGARTVFDVRGCKVRWRRRCAEGGEKEGKLWNLEIEVTLEYFICKTRSTVSVA